MGTHQHSGDVDGGVGDLVAQRRHNAFNVDRLPHTFQRQLA
jgi:hypothetical protein